MITPSNSNSGSNVIHWIDASQALNKQISRLPSQLQFEFESARNTIKTRIETIIANNNGEGDIDEIARIEFDKWVLNKSVEGLYESYYKPYMKSIGGIALSLDDFKSGNEKADPKAETPWKRFNLIRNRKISIGSRIIKKGSQKIFRVIGITLDLKLQLEGTDELENPVDFICFDSFKHLKEQGMKVGDSVVNVFNGTTNRIIGITSMGELKFEGKSEAYNTMNFLKNIDIPVGTEVEIEVKNNGNSKPSKKRCRVERVYSNGKLKLFGIESLVNPLKVLPIGSVEHLKKENIKVEDTVSDITNGKNYKVTGITEIGRLILEGLINPRDPIDFKKVNDNVIHLKRAA